MERRERERRREREFLKGEKFKKSTRHVITTTVQRIMVRFVHFQNFSLSLSSCQRKRRERGRKRKRRRERERKKELNSIIFYDKECWSRKRFDSI